MQRELRKSEQGRMGRLKDLNKKPAKRPTSYLLMSQLSGVIILKYGNARHLPRNGIKQQQPPPRPTRGISPTNPSPKASAKNHGASDDHLSDVLDQKKPGMF
ncbi:MAG: hypothetical protein ACJAVK_000742 [Akkermansiaceae bacterium]|jgi:hypothetical protein